MTLDLMRTIPELVTLTYDEVDRIERAQLALLLRITPREVDAMPLQDRWDVWSVEQANRRADSDSFRKLRP